MALKDVNEIKKALDAKKLLMGSSETIKNLKMGKVSKVYLSENCRQNVRDDIIAYSKAAKAECIMLNKSKEELGVLCKKSFSISVLSILSENKK